MTLSPTPEETLIMKRYPLNPKEILEQVDVFWESKRYLPDYPFKDNVETTFFTLKFKIGNLKIINYDEDQAIFLAILQLIISPKNEFENILDYHFLHHQPREKGHYLDRMEKTGLKFLGTLVKKKYLLEMTEEYQIWKKQREYLNWLRFNKLQMVNEEFTKIQAIEAGNNICQIGLEDAIYTYLRPFITNKDSGYLYEFLCSNFIHKMKVDGKKIHFLHTLKLLYDQKILFTELDLKTAAEWIVEIFYFVVGKKIPKNTMDKYFIQYISDKNPDKTYLIQITKNLGGIG